MRWGDLRGPRPLVCSNRCKVRGGARPRPLGEHRSGCDQRANWIPRMPPLGRQGWRGRTSVADSFSFRQPGSRSWEGSWLSFAWGDQGMILPRIVRVEAPSNEGRWLRVPRDNCESVSGVQVREGQKTSEWCRRVPPASGHLPTRPRAVMTCSS